MLRRMFAFVLLCCVMPVAAAAATTFTVTVPGTSNIFGAGLTAPPPVPVTPLGLQYPVESGPGTLPPSIAFTPDPYLVLHFPSITGGVGYWSGSGYAGPEGFDTGGLLHTNVSSTNGISGISMDNRVLFLVGVFLGGAQPATAPTSLNANNANNQVNFHPVLGQTFFIGDGHTAGGVMQNFFVPTGATHLYLGFADAWQFQGAPSWYGDNFGALNVSVSTSSQIPDPATVWLVAAPLGFLWYRSRRRRRA
jgi:hypothetical protein